MQFELSLTTKSRGYHVRYARLIPDQSRVYASLGDKGETNETVNRHMGAISMMAMANDEINSIKPSLNANYESLCSSQNVVTGNLFRDNITHQLKTIQESNIVGKKLSEDRPFFWTPEAQEIPG